ncbi:probable xyloglucan galactosyltransferase GT14 [Durio zibethinus]|uniref:Probable xyloglucan galactosyltransferase GT14 n=1 Tax=Durio zibethinus TaxID=66656 RepID=A0A6P5X2M4_DURZI|nr:probable xyloglucan galactosyltransferase GT14 [Durio zibethinus]
MEKMMIWKQRHNQLWFVVLVSFVFCLVLLCLDYSVLSGAKNGVSFIVHSFDYALNTQRTGQFVAIDKHGETSAPPSIVTSNQAYKDAQDFPVLENNVTLDNNVKEENKVQVQVQDVADQQPGSDWKREDPCSGKYIYVHHLPSRFNYNVLKDCRMLNKWFDMCPSLMNSGFGPKVESPRGVLSDRNWFETNQFLLEVIFHHRMKQYKCLTNNSSLASAIFVPFYAGLDIGRFLWGYNTSIRDSSAYDLVNWLGKEAEWKRMWGRDHFFVAGRIAWDFRRQTGKESDWGSRLMSLPESMNMTMLTIETSSWSNEFAIPYPTYFHPSSHREVIRWQKRMRSRKRRHLFSFAGAPRPSMNDSIRGKIINQCLASKNTCKFLDCQSSGNRCDTPVEVIKVFRDSIFCLQPPGDSYTRRSTFDSILAGCIPVFFHPYSAYAQYTWYFPKNYTKYSVYIPANDINDGRVSINKALSQFPKGQVLAMRKQVLKLIPKVIYADPMSRLELFEDAFDVAVKKVLERVEKVRKDIKKGKDPSVDFAVENRWKLKLSGIVGDHSLEQLI